ncbi:MAG: hypothetical protein JSS35_09810, partial [Proteobacteria bacterium]|nr:hypothetical protein [Pseudomonadota bacterium]
QRLRPRTPADKARTITSESSMAVIAIVIFLAVIAGLNRFEFGRFD